LFEHLVEKLLSKCIKKLSQDLAVKYLLDKIKIMPQNFCWVPFCSTTWECLSCRIHLCARLDTLSASLPLNLKFAEQYFCTVLLIAFSAFILFISVIISNTLCASLPLHFSNIFLSILQISRCSRYTSSCLLDYMMHCLCRV